MNVYDAELAPNGHQAIADCDAKPATVRGSRQTDKRHYPRVAMRHLVELNPVEVSNSSGEQVGATVVDLSPDGLRIALDHNAVRKVCPLGHLTSPADAVYLTVRMTYPGSITPGPGFEATGKVVHVRRLSQYGYQAGLKFDDLTERARSRLMRWLGAPDL